MACHSCGIEGFTNEVPTGMAPDMLSQVVARPVANNDFHQYMKSDCNYAAQSCMYTAQGEMVCPKEGLGDCGGQKHSEKHNGNGLFGMF